MLFFSNLNNKKILENVDNDSTFEKNLGDTVNSFYDIDTTNDNEEIRKARELDNKIRNRVGLEENFQNYLKKNNNYSYLIICILILLIVLFVLFFK